MSEAFEWYGIKVHEALDNALENGYHPRQNRHWDPAIPVVTQVATDLGTYCPDLEGLDEVTLGPHIESWLDKHTEDCECSQCCCDWVRRNCE